jgi:hypothetical protein
MNDTKNTPRSLSDYFGPAGLVAGFIVGYVLNITLLAAWAPLALIFAPMLGMVGGITLGKLTEAGR